MNFLSRHDIENVRRFFQDAINARQFTSSPTMLTFHKLIRTPNDTSAGYGLDDVTYDIYEDDNGFTESTLEIKVPCALVPRTVNFNIVDMGYEESSDLEVEVSTEDLVNHGITIDDIRYTFNYVKINTPNKMDIRGRPVTVNTQIWEVSSVRPLVFGGDLFGVRIGLKLREADASSLGVASR